MSNAPIKFSKEKYSENLIRKSLYWLSKECAWKLDENDNYWLIYVNTEGNNCEQQLHKLLNDNILREELDKQTNQVRYDIILSALKKVQSDS